MTLAMAGVELSFSLYFVGLLFLNGEISYIYGYSSLTTIFPLRDILQTVCWNTLLCNSVCPDCSASHKVSCLLSYMWQEVAIESLHLCLAWCSSTCFYYLHSMRNFEQDGSTGNWPLVDFQSECNFSPLSKICAVNRAKAKPPPMQ